MAEPNIIPEQYTAQSNSIASYSYTDIADKTGMVIFYGFGRKTSSGITYGLSKQSVYANPIETEAAVNDDGYMVRLDMDFDLSPFNAPQTLKGTAILNIPAYWVGAGNGLSGGYVIAKIRKYSGTTESDIASVQSENCGALASGVSYNKTLCMPVTIPQTHFKKGDILRLTIEMWADPVNYASGGTVAIAHDPQNRDGTRIVPSSVSTVTTTLTFHCPMRLDEIGA